MSLARKLTLNIMILIGCVLLMGAAALVGLVGLSEHFSTSSDQHQLLRSVYETGHHAASARLVMTLDTASSPDVARQLDAAIEEAQTMLAVVRGRANHFTPSDRTAIEEMLASLNNTRSSLDTLNTNSVPTAAVNSLLARTATLAGALQQQITATKNAGQRRLVSSVVTISVLLSLTLFVAIAAGVRQHRSVMRPIRALEEATAQISQGEFTHRVTPSGEVEFRRLADRFNTMAQELDRSYQMMRDQVESKSKQLVRSEQLAAVGRLAAGFAHEINNPLGIIAGYAESTQRRIAKADADETEATSLAEHTAQALQIITDEAFRCRQITDNLLCAARPETPTQSVNVAELIQRLLDVLGGLPQFLSRELVFAALGAEDCIAVLNPGELTQILCNLVTNALEAIPHTNGRVAVELEALRDRIIIRVRDNGRGMTEETLDRVFEPFFTDKLDRGESGTGLGLAVCHSLVERMNGRLDASSDGLGAGSVFTLELPLTPIENAQHA